MMEVAARIVEADGSAVAADAELPLAISPELVLPAQYFELLGGRRILEAEKRLMLAMLEDALHCFCAYAGAARGRRKRLFEDAAEWIFAPDPGWVFSFESICAALGIGASFLRQGLLRWARGHAASGAPAPSFPRVRPRAARRHRVSASRNRRAAGRRSGALVS